MAKKSGGDACSAMNCSNARYKEECKGLSFYQFPGEEVRCRLWIQNTRRQDLMGKSAKQLSTGGYKLCSDHFESSQFNRPAERNGRLVWNAVPTIFDVPNPPPAITLKRNPKDRSAVESSAKKPRIGLQSEREHYQPPDDQPNTSEGRSHPMRSLLKRARNKIYYQKKLLKQKPVQKLSLAQRKNRLVEDLHMFLPPIAANFIETQLRLIDKKKKGRRWTEHDKTYKAYKLLMKIFVLPSISTLRNAVRAVDIYPGFNNSILSALKHKIQCMPANAALCSLVFDEMTMKEKVSYNTERDEVEGLEDFGNYGKTRFVANHATVFLVRGLIINWKQPVGFFFSSGPMDSAMLHMLMIECIEKVTAAGLIVKCVVADQGTNNRKTFTKFCGITEQRPYFEHQGQKIHLFYDPPHLLKNIRNNLKKTGFSTDRGEICWQHIVDFFNFDRQGPNRLAPRLTEKHIRLPLFSTLRVKFAAQVLSHSVAVGISYIGRLRGDNDANETSVFVERFDQLFNAFNCGNLNSHQKMGHALKEGSGHTEFLLETLEWLKTVRSLSSVNLPCLQGWKMDIRSLIALWEDLNENYGVKFLLTNRLNQDCLENLFSQIRGNTSNISNPTAAEFRIFIRRTMVDHIFSQSDKSNCTADSAQFLLTLSHISTKSSTTESEFHDPASESIVQQENINEEEEEANRMLPMIATRESPPKDAFLLQAQDGILTYISGYIAKKLKPKVCASCQCLITGHLTDASNQEFLLAKQFNDCTTGLTVPSEELVLAVKAMESEFCKNIQQIVHAPKVRARLVMLMTNCTDQNALMCPEGKCDLKARIVRLFFNIRLHFILKDSSEKFSQLSVRRNRKIMNFSYL